MSLSSVRTYVWMEEKYPDLFKKIEQRIREGRWEVIGGMWVEPDLNMSGMSGGESLVRQILVGKHYFHDKFGIDVKIGWNPDSFGYSWQLPQIYKKSGIDYFVTQKLMWAHEFTTFPALRRTPRIHVPLPRKRASACREPRSGWAVSLVVATACDVL